MSGTMRQKLLMVLAAALLTIVSIRAGAASLSGLTPARAPRPCAPGAVYDPACDVDHDGDVDIFDIQLAAGHWSQSGAWTGGDFWSLTGNVGTTAGTHFLGTTDMEALELHVAGQRALRLEPIPVPPDQVQGGGNTPNLIGGHADNAVTPYVQGATIGGGGFQDEGHQVFDDFGTIGGGRGNRAGDGSGTLGDRAYATIGGGVNNNASGLQSTIGGGGGNTVSDASATVGGGASNTASGVQSTADNQFLVRAAGGVGISTNAPNAALAVDGGNSVARIAVNSNSPTANAGLNLRQDGVSRWSIAAVSTDGDLTFFREGAGGGSRLFVDGGGANAGYVGIGNTAPQHPLHMASGAHVTAGGTWTNASSRALKTDFADVDRTALLETLADLPITSWSYRAEAPSTRLNDHDRQFIR